MMARIALVTPDFPPTPGGVSDQSAALAQALRNSGGELAIFTRGNASIVANAEGVYAALDWGLRGVSHLVDSIAAWRPDIVILQYEPHMYQRQGLSASAAWLVWKLRRAGLPVVVCAHELHYAWEEGLRHWPVGIAQRIIAACLMRWSTGVVFTIQSRLAAARRAWPRARARLYAIPNGPNINPPVSRDRAGARTRLRLPSDALVIVSWGSDHPSFQREHLTVTSRHFEHSNLPVTFAVGGAITPLPGAFRHLGYCDRDVMSDWMQAADFAVLPWREGASARRTTLMNALAHGLPVLSTDGSQTDATLRESGALHLVPPNRPDLLALAATTLARDDATRAQAAAAADILFHQQFDWTILSREWMTVLTQARSQPD